MSNPLSKPGLLLAVVLLIFISHSKAQQTVGLFVNDSTSTWSGYTLLAPKMYTSTWLINNDGEWVHRWTHSAYPPGQSVYLLPNGNLLRTCSIQNDSLSAGLGGGEGGRIEEYNWNDSLLWAFNYSTPSYMQHHDICPLPNGDILLLAVEKKTLAEALAAGFNPAIYQPNIDTVGYILPEYVVEIAPMFPDSATIVWEWHSWDHLIQDFDSTKSNYGVVAEHPELDYIDKGGNGNAIPCFFLHGNSITYNAKFDQIVLSMRGNSEIWVIDHSTTTAQAQGHTGGKYGKGGDLLYRWGNPMLYEAKTGSQTLWQQHDAQYIDSTCPGAGDILVWDNGDGRGYSSADEFHPSVDSNGNYSIVAGDAYGPTGLAWTYEATPPQSLYCPDIGSVQRFPNGNTLINDGVVGTMFEVTSAGDVVWKYVSPVVRTGPLAQGDTLPNDPNQSSSKLNAVFRAIRYPLTFSAFEGKTLIPQGYIETYPVSVNENLYSLPTQCELYQNSPNPFNAETIIGYQLPASGFVSLVVNDVFGNIIARIVDGNKEAGFYNAQFSLLDGQHPSGVYFYTIRYNGMQQTKPMLFVK